MPQSLEDIFVIGVSSRALFDLEEENKIFEKKGLDEYRKYQIQNEGDLLKKGTAFSLVESLLQLNALKENKKYVEVVVMSRNSPDTGLRMMNSIEQYGLDITRTVLTGGDSLSPYLEAFSIDLFLSKDEDDIQNAIDNDIVAAIIYDTPDREVSSSDTQVTFAFDADAVVFSEESELIYKTENLEAFLAHELKNRDSLLNDGPFAKLIRVLAKIQKDFPFDSSPISIAIVTARNSSAGIRVIKTLRVWDVYTDKAFFLGGVSKDEVLQSLKPHIFFDDQDTHVGPASRVVASARVPYKSHSKLSK